MMPSAADKQLLTVSDLSIRFRYADKSALQSVSFSIGRGERVAILGASGSGKTTLLHAVMGIVPGLIPAEVSGSIVWDASPPALASRAAAWSRASFLSQATGPQIATLAVADEIAFPLQSRAMAAGVIDHRVADALATPLMSGLSENASTLTLSGGWRQRLAFAATLAARSDCIVLDEPLAHLDMAARFETLRILREELDAEQTLVIVDHCLDLIPDITQRVIVLGHDGSCLADGAASSILTDSVLLEKAGLARGQPQSKPTRDKALQDKHEPLLTISDATLQRDGTVLLDHLNLTLNSGEIVSLHGRNGTGKTSLALAMVGGLRFQKGRMTLYQGARPLLVPQNPNLFFATGSLADEVRRFHLPWDVFANNAAQLGLRVAAGDHPFRFSQGQKRRLALALAMPQDDITKRIFILDEPQAGLDGVALADLSDALFMLAKAGHAIFIIAHDRKWLNAIADSTFAIVDQRLQDTVSP